MIHLTELLQKKHQKSDFKCGSELLDNYLKFQASQDVKRKLCACFVIVDTLSQTVKGYYTLSNNSIPLHIVPESFRKNLPKSYKSIPTTLLGRLAVSENYKGNNLGKHLLIDALKRSSQLSSAIGSFAVVVDPINKNAANFYKKYGFIHLPESGKMFLPMKTITHVFS
jgi:predicted GNAT family N-acyltransferase